MIRVCCLGLIVAMTNLIAIPAQPKKDIRKSFMNSIGMKFVWIPPGSFLMGSPKEEKWRGVHETQHKVTLTKGFYMGAYTVTQEQWAEFMDKNPSRFQGKKNLPVEMVPWKDCQEFIKKLRDKEKKPYRLPTEAEWEYACRAGTTTPFHFGEIISRELANYGGHHGEGKAGVSKNKTMPVGSYPPNAWGLYDMHGNVFQWCQDWSRYEDYSNKDVVDPQGPEKQPGILGELVQDHVRRGGDWNSYSDFCRSAFRSGTGPGGHGGPCGFRLCFFPD